jgi:DNA-binding response OmpR family regulator
MRILLVEDDAMIGETGLDGLEVLRRLRARRQANQTPEAKS